MGLDAGSATLETTVAAVQRMVWASLAIVEGD
jgi:hypothetical protein